MADTHDNLHIAMLPWLAFGHMTPYMELAKLMAAKGHRISFLSAPRNIDRLPKPPPELAPLISFVKLPLPAVENLPEGAEATSDLPYDKIQYLKKAFDMLQEPVARFLEERLVHYHDRCQLGIHWAGMGFEGGDYRKTPEDFTTSPKWVPFPTKVAFHLFEIKKIFDVVTGNASGVTDLYRMGTSQECCDIIALRSSYEVEPEWLSLLKDIHAKPVFPVGQLPPGDPEGRGETDTWRSIKEWLDAQRKGTVVYVAFGSESKPSQTELTEIALGLELSGLPFFWVLKTRLGSADTESVVLPDGFEERVKGRGVVWDSWVPQLKILAHDSVGGFLTHGGWNSAVEALSLGEPCYFHIRGRSRTCEDLGGETDRVSDTKKRVRRVSHEAVRGRVAEAHRWGPGHPRRYTNDLLNYLKEHSLRNT
ncbi:uncharacterized protein J3R85_006364 [Psidium guajava]|nr:uncharacterized protein J3R85_006364 [Psidium guajava]